ncbi:MAG TPA: SGNH/GDSL hydrolase family protein [Blastocatellia bacterium]|nr:SGNH/GDSL hydrolase family protein [Blastocatellia bacterium]
MKRVLRILRQTLVILFITVAMSEIVFRVFNYIHPSPIFHNNSYMRFRGHPHDKIFNFHLNSKGFKDVEFDDKKQEGTYRILGLGDSFAFGVVPYENNYLTLLEENLNKNSRKTELLNMGIPGIGPKDYLALLNDEGLKLQPDMVLLSFFIGNDFLRETEESGLYSYSYLAAFIHYFITVGSERLVVPSDTYNDSEPTFTEARFVGIENERSEIYRKQNESFESDFAEAMSYLEKIKQRCAERNINFAVVLIPDEVQINKTLQARVMQIKAFNANPDEFDFALPNKLIAARLKEKEIKFVDLLDDFARQSNQTALYKIQDTHWNIAGNKLAAELIQKNLFSGQPTTSATDQSATNSEPSSCEGFHEATDCHSIKGWAWDTLRPNDAVAIEIYDGDQLLATVTANQFRKDLLDARKGNGAHAIDYPVPAQLKDGKPHLIRLKVAGNIYLTGTSKQLECKPE